MDKDIFAYEMQLFREGYRLIAGTDEAGRGPLAGPVVSAAIILPLDEQLRIPGVRDSKKLSEKKRDALYDILISQAIAYGIGYSSPEEIDRINIREASRLSMKRAVENLEIVPDFLLVDAEKNLDVSMPQMGIIKGDDVSYLIGAASILAKVTRDRWMLQIHEEYPQYDFAKHKGYGTKAHMQALDQYGPCPWHRESFLKKWRASAHGHDL